MPVDMLAKMLEESLSSAGVGPAEVITAEIYQLSPQASTVVIDEMVAGAAFPMVLVGDRVVCTGGVDLPAVLEATGGV